jgi:hypothetical protein
MSNVQERRDQLSVPVDSDLRAAVERVAKREDRTLAAQVRVWIVAGLEQHGEQRAA